MDACIDGWMDPCSDGGMVLVFPVSRGCGWFFWIIWLQPHKRAEMCDHFLFWPSHGNRWCVTPQTSGLCSASGPLEEQDWCRCSHAGVCRTSAAAEHLPAWGPQMTPSGTSWWIIQRSSGLVGSVKRRSWAGSSAAVFQILFTVTQTPPSSQPWI